MLVFLDILSARFFFAVANPSSIILISEVALGTLIITLFLFQTKKLTYRTGLIVYPLTYESFKTGTIFMDNV